MTGDLHVSQHPRLQLGGGIGPSSGKIYVKREADDVLLDRLRGGVSGYFMAPKQTGKSSLAFNIKHRLEEDGIECAYLDLTGLYPISEDMSAEVQCQLLAEAILAGYSIDPSDIAHEFWARPEASPSDRLLAFVEKRVIGSRDNKLVVFIDESDTIEQLLPGGSELAAAIAKLSATKGEGSACMTFCLLGSISSEQVLSWHPLMNNAIGWVEQLADFQRQDIDVFHEVVAPIFCTKCTADEALDECFRLTSGHPFLTQFIVSRAVALGDNYRQSLARKLQHTIDDLCIRPDVVLSDAEERLKSPVLNPTPVADRLDLFKKLLDVECVEGDTGDIVQIALYLSGVATFRTERGAPTLCLRNSIFSQYFDEEKIEGIRLRLDSPADKELPKADDKTLATVDRIFCTGTEGRRPPYTRKNDGRVLIRDKYYEFRLADSNRRSVTLQLFKGLGGIGGELWHRLARTLLRIGGHRLKSLSYIIDGGHNHREDLAYIITRGGNESLRDQPDVTDRLRSDRREALILFIQLAEGLAKLHSNGLVHRNLTPASIDVVRKYDSDHLDLRLTRFEMSALVTNLLRGLDQRRGGARMPGQPADSDEAVELLPFSDLLDLFAINDTQDFVFLAPEVLALLFQAPGADTVDGTHSDVFGLGMLLYTWVAGDIPGNFAETVFPHQCYEPNAHREFLERLATSLGSAGLPDRLDKLLREMLSYRWRNRPTVFHALNKILAILATLDLDDNTEDAQDRFIVTYFPTQMVDYFRHREWIRHGSSSEAGHAELRELLLEDLRNPVITYSPKGSAPFEYSPKDTHRRARFVLLGNQFSHFCDLYKTYGARGKPVDQALVILYSHPTEKTRSLEKNNVSRHAPALELLPEDAEEMRREDIGNHPSWREFLDDFERIGERTERNLDSWGNQVEDSLDWLLNLRRVQFETRTYPVDVTPLGPNTYEMVWNDVRDAKYLRSDGLRNLYGSRGHGRQPMGTFFSDLAEESDRLVFLEDSRGYPDWNGTPVRIRLLNQQAANKLEVEIVDNTRSLPVQGWLQPADDSGSLWQLKRERAAYDDLIEMPELVDQLGSPVSAIRLQSYWGEIGPELRGEAPSVIRQMLDSWPLFALHGPPGTGKTTVAARAVYLALDVDLHQRILVSAQSHYSLDNLAEKILEEFERRHDGSIEPLRIASPGTVEKVSPPMRNYLLNERASKRVAEIVSNCKRLLDREYDVVDDENGQVRHALLERWLNTIESCHLEVLERIRRGSNLVFCTTAGSANRDSLSASADEPFDWVIIEEAAKAWLTELAMPLTQGNRWALIGDHKQLGAFRKHEVVDVLTEMARAALEETDLLEHAGRRGSYLRVFDFFKELFEEEEASAVDTPLKSELGWESYASRPVASLTTQFRMRTPIANLISDVFYDSKLKTDPSADSRDFSLELPGWFGSHALHWIDTGGIGVAPESKPHWCNPNEVEITKKLLFQLERSAGSLQKGTVADHLAVLSPYAKQVARLEQGIGDRFGRCVSTVDAFQGRESDIVIVSMVRCNEESTQRMKLGFLTEPQRINVLFSRARFQLVIIGSLEHFERSITAIDESRLWVDICKAFRRYGAVHRLQDVGLQLDG